MLRRIMTLNISKPISIAEANQLLLVQNPATDETTLKVVECIAQHSNSKLIPFNESELNNLENKLKKQLAKTSPETFQSICQTALLSGQMKMIDVCKRICALKFDAIKLAKKEAKFTPKTTRAIEQLSESAFPYLKRIANFAGHLFNFICVSSTFVCRNTFSMLFGPILLFIAYPIQAFLQDGVVKSPTKVFNEVFNSIYEPGVVLATSYYEQFETKKKAHIVALAIVASAVALFFIHRKFRLGVPENLDKKELFQNLSSKVVMESTIQQIEGRDEEKDQLMLAWQVPQGEKYQIGLLLGPTGIGKTEFVNGLAWESVNDKSSFVYGKTIYSINVILLANQEDPLRYFRKKILPSIEGHEDDIVLFFDEGHSAGEKKGKIAPLIELFKTELLEKNFRCLLGTTTDDYENFIAGNKAFVDRCKTIHFHAPSDQDMIRIIQKKVICDESRIFEFEPDAYQAMINVSKNNPEYKNRSNPRKTIDLYKEINGYVGSWRPTKLKAELKKLNHDITMLNSECNASNNKDPYWISSEKGQKAVQSLEDKRVSAKTLQDRIDNQTRQFQAITRNLLLEPVYRKNLYQAVHVVADAANQPSEQAKQNYLFIKFVLRPALQSVVLTQTQKFKADFPEEEEIPIKIDAALIQKRFPSSFSAKLAQ